MDDKATKPYVPIDTYSPAGTWIEEKRYNKNVSSSTNNLNNTEGSTSRKVLCGNWQEEQALESDLLQQEEQIKQLSTSGRNFDGTSSLKNNASLYVIRNKGNGYYAGGFNSTPYVVCDSRHPDERCLSTTYTSDFNPRTADVRSLRRPELGVRSKALLEQALKLAAEEEKREAELKAALQDSIVPQSLKNIGGPQADLAKGSVFKSTYNCSHGIEEYAEKNKYVVDEIRNEYLSEVPITLYTGNPHTGKTMTVHGKTPVDACSGSLQFGRHTHFTEPKYHL